MHKQMQRLELDIKHSNTITGPKTKLKSCKFIPCKEVFKSQETAVCEEDCRVECSSGRPGEAINATHKQVNRQKWLKSSGPGCRRSSTGPAGRQSSSPSHAQCRSSAAQVSSRSRRRSAWTRSQFHAAQTCLNLETVETEAVCYGL